jgi:hypothetical protein
MNTDIETSSPISSSCRQASVRAGPSKRRMPQCFSHDAARSAPHDPNGGTAVPAVGRIPALGSRRNWCECLLSTKTVRKGDGLQSLAWRKIWCSALRAMELLIPVGGEEFLHSFRRSEPPKCSSSIRVGVRAVADLLIGTFHELIWQTRYPGPCRSRKSLPSRFRRPEYRLTRLSE